MQRSSFLRHLDFQSVYTVKLYIKAENYFFLYTVTPAQYFFFLYFDSIFKCINKCIGIMEYTLTDS